MLNLQDRLDLFPLETEKPHTNEVEITDSFNTTYSPSYSISISFNTNNYPEVRYANGSYQRRTLRLAEVLVIIGCILGIWWLVSPHISIPAAISFFSYLR